MESRSEPATWKGLNGTSGGRHDFGSMKIRQHPMLAERFRLTNLSGVVVMKTVGWLSEKYGSSWKVLIQQCLHSGKGILAQLLQEGLEINEHLRQCVCSINHDQIGANSGEFAHIHEQSQWLARIRLRIATVVEQWPSEG